MITQNDVCFEAWQWVSYKKNPNVKSRLAASEINSTNTTGNIDEGHEGMSKLPYGVKVKRVFNLMGFFFVWNQKMI